MRIQECAGHLVQDEGGGRGWGEGESGERAGGCEDKGGRERADAGERERAAMRVRVRVECATISCADVWAHLPLGPTLGQARIESCRRRSRRWRPWEHRMH